MENHTFSHSAYEISALLNSSIITIIMLFSRAGDDGEGVRLLKGTPLPEEM